MQQLEDILWFICLLNKGVKIVIDFYE